MDLCIIIALILLLAVENCDQNIFKIIMFGDHSNSSCWTSLSGLILLSVGKKWAQLPNERKKKLLKLFKLQLILCFTIKTLVWRVCAVFNRESEEMVIVQRYHVQIKHFVSVVLNRRFRGISIHAIVSAGFG